MNIQILSNSKNDIGVQNEINNFTMKLVEPIDAENHPKYITVLSVSYPLTTKKFQKTSVFFYLSFTFDNFREHSLNGGYVGRLNFETNKITIPDGVYSIGNIVDFMNNWLEEDNVNVEKMDNGKISFHMSYGVEFWFIQY